jgi:pyrroline-5-carboxylate reductase
MNTLPTHRFAILGMGNVGQLFLGQLQKFGVPGEQLMVCDTNRERVQAAADRSGAQIIDLTSAPVGGADIWLLCTGPKAILPVLRQAAPFIKAGDTVISFAAAVPSSALAACIPVAVNLARVMPNMPSLVGQGMNPVFIDPNAASQTRELLSELLTGLGESIEVQDEQMNWCSGLSGAPMRSLLPVLEGMIRAGQEAGLSEAVSRQVAAQVMLGTASLVKSSPESLATIKTYTPMETVNELEVAELFYQAAVGVRNKLESMQEKILAE